ncbi:MAG: sulfatase-like hydrolase/transferase [Pseudomonadota bacterium]
MKQPGKPNIVVIVADDLGYGDIGCFGNTVIRTPNIDRLAAGGVTFTQHYTASPICAPARASLLTGRYNHVTGALSVESNRGIDRISMRLPLIGDLFGAAGYATGMFGKWHNGLFDRQHHPNARGFSEFGGFLNGAMGYFDWFLDYNGVSKKSDGRYLTDVFTSEAVDFIARHKADPFLLYIAYSAPHAPFEAPEATIQRYREVGGLDEGVCRIYAMIEHMDLGVGRILDQLLELGMYENTMVLVTSDNGPLLGRHSGYNLERYNGPFRGAKTEVLEGGIRVPAILRWPAQLAAGSVCDSMIHFTDWLPSLLAAAGVQARRSTSFDGCAFLFEQGLVAQFADIPRFWQFNRYDPVARCNAAMRDGKWKLCWPDIPEAMKKIPGDVDWYERLKREPHFYFQITDNPSFSRSLPSPGRAELFDLEKDPYEKTDLSVSHPDVCSKMILELDNWFWDVNQERVKLAEAVIYA